MFRMGIGLTLIKTWRRLVNHILKSTNVLCRIAVVKLIPVVCVSPYFRSTIQPMMLNVIHQGKVNNLAVLSLVYIQAYVFWISKYNIIGILCGECGNSTVSVLKMECFDDCKGKYTIYYATVILGRHKEWLLNDKINYFCYSYCGQHYCSTCAISFCEVQYLSPNQSQVIVVLCTGTGIILLSLLAI